MFLLFTISFSGPLCRRFPGTRFLKEAFPFAAADSVMNLNERVWEHTGVILGTDTMCMYMYRFTGAPKSQNKL